MVHNELMKKFKTANYSLTFHQFKKALALFMEAHLIPSRLDVFNLILKYQRERPKEVQGGGKDIFRLKRKEDTTEKVFYNKRWRNVYIGKRGGKYVKDGDTYVSVRSIKKVTQ